MRKNLLFLLIIHTSSVFGQGNGLYQFVGKNGKYGFMDMYGNVKVNPNYLIVKDFSEGLAFVSKDVIKKGYKWICIDTSGNEVFDIKDNFPETDFSEGFARISSLKEEWFIDKKGIKVFNRSFADGIGNFNNGFAVVSDEQFQNYYYINVKGEKVIFLPTGNLRPFNNGLATIFKRGFPIVDTLGSYVGDNFERVDGWNEGLIKVKKNGKWGFIDTKGKQIIPFKFGEGTDPINDSSMMKFKNVSLFYDGLAKFQSDSLWGAINMKNEIAIEPKFKHLNTFSEGLAAATLDGKKWGFVDKTGSFVIKPQYYSEADFQNGICAVTVNGHALAIAGDYYFDAIINKKGEILNNIEMHCYLGFQGDLIKYFGGPDFSGGVYYINKMGKKVTPKD